MPDEFIEAIERSEAEHPGIHERLYDYLQKEFPGEPIDADEFLKEPEAFSEPDDH
jgi:hypothetical protein